METVTFSADVRATDPVVINGRVVVREAPVAFRADSYPDKQFSITPEELKKAAEAFTSPVELDVEHKSSIFDGKLGRMVSVNVNPDGKTLACKYAIPKWLHDITDKKPLKVSISFDRATKKIKGCGLTVNPRIEDAVMFNAMSSDEEANGPVGDDILIGGRKPGAGGDSGGMPCQGTDLFRKIVSMLEASRNSADEKIYDKKYLKTLDDLIEKCRSYSGEQTVDMSRLDEQTRKLIEDKDKAIADATKRLDEIREREIKSDAVSFANDIITVKKKAFPSQKDAIIAGYIAAAKSDDVCFSATKTAGTMLESFKKAFESHPTHNLTESAIKDINGQTVITADFSTPPSGDIATVTADRRAALLGKTRMGRQILAAEKNGK